MFSHARAARDRLLPRARPRRWSCTAAGPPARRAARPLLGEHTEEILADVLGLGEAEIGRLFDAGTVAGAAIPA